MRSTLWTGLFAAAAAALALAGPSSALPRAAQAAETWEVLVGQAEPPGYEAQTFGPRMLTVHVGDTVSWNFQSFHTVTFLGNQPPSPAPTPTSAS